MALKQSSETLTIRLCSVYKYLFLMPPGRTVRFMWSSPQHPASPTPHPSLGPVSSHICLQPARSREEECEQPRLLTAGTGMLRPGQFCLRCTHQGMYMRGLQVPRLRQLRRCCLPLLREQFPRWRAKGGAGSFLQSRSGEDQMRCMEGQPLLGSADWLQLGCVQAAG